MRKFYPFLTNMKQIICPQKSLFFGFPPKLPSFSVVQAHKIINCLKVSSSARFAIRVEVRPLNILAESFKVQEAFII
jgi:hypothetical protein